MTETRMEFWQRRGRELRKQRKAALCSLYRSLGGLGGMHPPELWTKEEVVGSIVDIEWGRLPDDAKRPAPEHMSPPCDLCGKGQDVTAHRYGGSHNYRHTADPSKQWVPSREPCATPGCGRPYEHHEAWDLGHQYTAPAEEQPAPPADATAPRCDSHECMSPNCAFPGKCVRVKVADATREAWIERPSGAPVRVLVDGPGCTPAAVSVPCLGESCTGCSDPQCWTARADGGDA